MSGKNEGLAVSQVLKFARVSVRLGEYLELEAAVKDAVKWVGYRLGLDLGQQDDLADAALEAAWELEVAA